MYLGQVGEFSRRPRALIIRSVRLFGADSELDQLEIRACFKVADVKL